MAILTLNSEVLKANDGKIISDIQNGVGGYYYKRYPDNGYNKLFISSKYLKDAVIDSGNNITSLKSSIGTFAIVRNSGTIKLNKGIDFGSNSIMSCAGFPVLGLSDFFIGYWVKATATVGELFRNYVYCYWLGNGTHFKANFLTYTVSDGIKTLDSPTYDVPYGNWNYCAFVRNSGTLYILVDGILKASGNMNYNLGRTTIEIGYQNPFNSDDFLVSIGDSILNPTTWTSNPKKFEPPRRGEFDGTIKQY